MESSEGRDLGLKSDQIMLYQNSFFPLEYEQWETR